MAGRSKAFLRNLRRKYGLGEFRKSRRSSRSRRAPKASTARRASARRARSFNTRSSFADEVRSAALIRIGSTGKGDDSQQMKTSDYRVSYGGYA